MSSNAERLRAMYEGFWHQGDTGSGLELMHPEIEFRGLEGDPLLGVNAHGPREIGAFFSDWLEAWDDFEIDFELTEVTPDIVVVESRFHARGKGSGLDFGSEIGQVWYFEDGRAVREVMYRTPEEAHEAAKAAASQPRD